MAAQSILDVAKVRLDLLHDLIHKMTGFEKSSGQIMELKEAVEEQAQEISALEDYLRNGTIRPVED